MFASLERQAGLRTHERIRIYAGESPSRANDAVASDSPILVYRCGGSAGFGSVKRLNRAPASRFTRRSFRLTPKTPAKHLTTSVAMLTAASADGKAQTPVDPVNRLID
jgi:hypothetical protein